MKANLIILAIAGLWLCGWWFWPQINFYAANYRYNNYRYDDAIDAYSASIKSNRLSKNILGKSYLGRAQAKMALAYATRAEDKEIYDAVLDYNKAIELIPNNLVYFRERGTAYAYLGGYDEAFRDFEMIGKLEVGKPVWSLVRKGGLEKRIGEHEKAVVTLQKVIDAWNPTPIMPPNYHLALTHLELEQYEEVINAINEGEKAQTDYGSAYIIRACAKANLLDFDAAIIDYEKGFLLNQSLRQETEIEYPSQKHDAKIQTEELAYLKSLKQGALRPKKERLKKLCFQNWWNLYFDIQRERSTLLP